MNIYNWFRSIDCGCFWLFRSYQGKDNARGLMYHKIVYYDTSAIKLFLTSVSLQHEPRASDVITLVKKTFSHEYRTKFYITRCENADFRTRSVRKNAFYTRSDIKYLYANGNAFFLYECDFITRTQQTERCESVSWGSKKTHQ